LDQGLNNASFVMLVGVRKIRNLATERKQMEFLTFCRFVVFCNYKTLFTYHVATNKTNKA